MVPTVLRVPLGTASGLQEGGQADSEEEEILKKKRPRKIQKKYDEREKNATISSLPEEQFREGKLLASITPRPDLAEEMVMN